MNGTKVLFYIPQLARKIDRMDFCKFISITTSQKSIILGRKTSQGIRHPQLSMSGKQVGTHVDIPGRQLGQCWTSNISLSLSLKFSIQLQWLRKVCKLVQLESLNYSNRCSRKKCPRNPMTTKSVRWLWFVSFTSLVVWVVQ